MRVVMRSLNALSNDILAILVEDHLRRMSLTICVERDESVFAGVKQLPIAVGKYFEPLMPSPLRKQMSPFTRNVHNHIGRELIVPGKLLQKLGIDGDSFSLQSWPISPVIFGCDASHYLVHQLPAAIPIRHNDRALACFVGDHRTHEAFVYATM